MEANPAERHPFTCEWCNGEWPDQRTYEMHFELVSLPRDHPYLKPAAPAEGLEGARVRLIGKIALILDGDGGWERQSRAAIVRSIDEVFEPIIRAAKRADR